MYTLVVIIIVLLAIIGLSALYSVFKNQIHFYITGLDAGFSIFDLSTLWQTSQLCDLEQPTSLFYSLNSLTKCMSHIQSQSQSNGEENSAKNQLLMTKLFDFRTKIQNESDEKKGLSSTKTLEKGQKLRIILPGKGVFASEVVNNGNMIVIPVPKQNNLIPISGEDWVGKVISVYFWRKGDARYVFDSTVEQQGLYLGKSSLYLRHSYNLVRTQKRKAVRSACEIYGQLFIVRNSEHTDSIETNNGYKCLIQDISESGALIKIGGKGVENIKIKLQFSIHNKLIIMIGVVRSVEFNEETNQSLLHFECTKIDPIMKNEILSFVYNMLPENEKEILEAIAQTDDDITPEEKINQTEDNVIDSDLKETDIIITTPETENSQTSDNEGDIIISVNDNSSNSNEEQLNIF